MMNLTSCLLFLPSLVLTVASQPMYCLCFHLSVLNAARFVKKRSMETKKVQKLLLPSPTSVWFSSLLCSSTLLREKYTSRQPPPPTLPAPIFSSLSSCQPTFLFLSLSLSLSL